MHILIFAATHNVAEKMQAALDQTEDQYTVAIEWADVLCSLENDPPDLILVERTVLMSLEPTTLLNLTEPGRWPTMLLVDEMSDEARDGVALARALAQTLPPFYRVGELYIDTRRKQAGIGDRRVNLPPIQYRLLLALARQAGEVVSYQALLRVVWGYDGDDRQARELLKEHIRRIRRRLGLNPKEYPYIRSVRGFGYMLASPDED